MKNDNMFLLLLVAGAGAYFLLKKMPDDQRSGLANWARSQSDGAAMLSAIPLMSDAEINATHQFVFDYYLKNIQVPSELRARIDVISSKYNIFT